VRIKDNYKHGDHNRICDRSGFKVKASRTSHEWNGLIVRVEDWEPRHPQDFVRGVPDRQSVDDPRPGAADTAVGTSTTLDADELPAQTVLSVTATTDASVGDAIIVFLDNGESHISDITSIADGDTITIADELPSKASSGNNVVIISSPVQESAL